MTRSIYFFGGGKGAGLAEMSKARIPVPPGFTIATSVCMDYYKNGKKTPKGLDAEQKKFLAQLEKEAGKKLGDPKNPLLVSVRSGAKVSMPGMMDTILNLGLNDKTVEGQAARTRNPRFAYDCYRRFIMMFADVVFDVPKGEFEALLHKRKEQKGVHSDTELTALRFGDLVHSDSKARCAEVMERALAGETLTHVELTLVPEGVAVRDLGSRNGTFYLGQRVERIVLTLGSRLRIGGGGSPG